MRGNKWRLVKHSDGSYFQSDSLLCEGFNHAFFSKHFKGKDPNNLISHLDLEASIHRTSQVHGSRIVEATQATRPPWPPADGLISNKSKQSLWISSADCIPILIANLDDGMVSACHAGWRGLAKRIPIKSIFMFKKRGANLKNLLISFGPAISGAKYKVDKDVAYTIIKSIKQSPNTNQNKYIQQGLMDFDGNSRKVFIDIRLMAAKQLSYYGISTDQISICPLCTFSLPTFFNSWRRDKVKATQWSVIVSNNKDSLP